MIDNNSQTWLILKDLLEDRLRKLREKNDTCLNLNDTNMLRGQIRELKWLLKIPESKKGAVASDNAYM